MRSSTNGSRVILRAMRKRNQLWTKVGRETWSCSVIQSYKVLFFFFSPPDQLSRLHMILKPFMLRRIKKDVEHEMAEKIEVHLTCGLSIRQKKLYYRLRERISIDDLLCSSSTTSYHSSKDSTSHLMNLVMQFRKARNSLFLSHCYSAPPLLFC